MEKGKPGCRDCKWAPEWEKDKAGRIHRQAAGFCQFPIPVLPIAMVGRPGVERIKLAPGIIIAKIGFNAECPCYEPREAPHA